MILSFVFLIGTAQSAAAQCNSHATLRSASGLSHEGAYMSSVTTTMDANWSTTQRPFVLKTLWATTDSSGSWVEVGFMDGDLNGSDHYGYYTAYGTSTGTYAEFTVSGFSTTPGQTHNFQVQYIGGNYWRAYVDFTTVKDYWMSSTSGSFAQVGFETGAVSAPYTSFTWTNPNYTTAHQYKTSGGVWNNWASGSTYTSNGCTNSAFMPTASFGTTGGSTDYSKGTFN